MRHIPMHLDEFIMSRHEISRANLALAHSARGDDSLLNAIRHIPDREHTLTAEGIIRSAHIGRWLTRNGLVPFDHYYVSEYIRAQETKEHMAILGAQWIIDGRLNERDWGKVGMLSLRDRNAQYPDWKQAKEAAPYDWHPDGGEPLRQHKDDFASWWREVNMRFPGKRIFCKCHGEKLLVGQAEIEGMSQEVFAVREKCLRLDNGCMVHYKKNRGGAVYKRFIDPHRDVCTEWRPLIMLAA